MSQTHQYRSALAAAALMLAVLLAWPTTGSAQTVTGDAKAVQATVFSPLGTPTTTTLADTGTLGGTTDARDASQLTGNIPSLLTGEAPHAVTIGYSDEVDTEAAVESLDLTVAGVDISADSVMSQASSMLGTAGTGSSTLSGLSINGLPVVVTGEANQTIAIPGGRVVINEQLVSPGGITVNALHVIVNGVADVVIASATAGIS